MRLLSPLRAAISIVASSRMSTVPNSSNRGAFILFEGGDRCGKSTQTKLIQESLAERGVVVEVRGAPVCPPLSAGDVLTLGEGIPAPPAPTVTEYVPKPNSCAEPCKGEGP